MTTNVHKFGGSCLSSAADIDAIVSRVQHSTNKQVLIVSAFRGVTDRIMEQIDSPRPNSITPFVSSIEIEHLESVPEIIDSPWAVRFAETLHVLANRLAEYDETPTPTIRADALACGERLSSLAVAAALDAAGIPAQPSWSEDVGIRLIGTGEFAHIDAEKTQSLIDLPMGAIPVITGWYGVTKDGIALLGRGGSDLTATTVAAALDANEVTIWRDVQGVLALSPRWALPGRNLRNLSYTEAAELALFSEPMLHPNAVEPLRKIGIPLHIRPLHEPESNGTIIGPSINTETPVIRAIGCLPHLVPLSWTLSSALSLTESVSNATTALGRERIRIASLRALPGRVRLLVPARMAARAERVLRDKPSLPTPIVGEPMSILCFVGEGIGQQVDIRQQIALAASNGGIDLTFNDDEIRDHALHAAVPANQTEDALQTLCSSLGLLVN